jgi:predicted membrane-bound dolichyl-phosphate-mannose-protein mannosyltransferase
LCDALAPRRAMRLSARLPFARSGKGGRVNDAARPGSPRARERIRARIDALRASAPGRLVSRAYAALHEPARAIAVLLLLALGLRVIWLNVPAHGFIFDETYYVNAARIILGWPASAHYIGSTPGFDPNTEHPALGKLLIAGSMRLLGDNAIAWRLPSVIAGMISLAATYLIARDAGRSAWLAILVTGIVAFDNLTFIHGRIGTLDMLVLAPMLVGSWLALRKRWILAGIALGIALLIKITALYAIGAVLLYALLTDGPGWFRGRRIPRFDDLRGPIGFLVITFSVGLAGLTILDASLSQFPSPIDHIIRIFTYGANLNAPTNATGICPAIDSKPWQWIFNECQIPYYSVNASTSAGGAVVATFAKIAFVGALNPLLASAIPIAMLFAGAYAWRTRDQLALWAIAWGLANYVPYLLLGVFTKRIMYIYYALPLVPALAIGVALLLTRAGLPRFVRWGFLAAYVLGFVAYFPFRQIP